MPTMYTIEEHEAQQVKPYIDSHIQTLSNREQERWGTVNLFDKDIMADVQIIELSYKTLYMKPNTTYTVSTDLPQNSENFANIFVYNSSNVPDTGANGVWNGQTRTFTTKSDGIINVAYRTKEFTNTSTKWFLNHNFQIEEGNVATAFQPYAAPNVTLTQDTKGLPQDINGLTENQFENGAVNLLHCDATSNVQTGLTYIVEDDGTIKVSGTNTSNETAQIAVTISYVDWDSTKRYRISGCPSNGSSSSYRLGLTIVKSDNSWSRTLTELGDGLEFQLASNETKIKVSINISAGYAISGTLTFKPMITVADMPNSDYAHYVPYCKSNKELTDVKANKSDLASISITGTTNNTGRTIASGTCFYLNGTLVRAIVGIDSNATLTQNTNYKVVTAGALNEPIVFYNRGNVSSSSLGNYTQAGIFQVYATDVLTEGWGILIVTTNNAVVTQTLINGVGIAFRAYKNSNWSTWTKTLFS